MLMVWYSKEIYAARPECVTKAMPIVLNLQDPPGVQSHATVLSKRTDDPPYHQLTTSFPWGILEHVTETWPNVVRAPVCEHLGTLRLRLKGTQLEIEHH
jgi:hypothetical protein